jgi:hypothetical protein
MASTPAKDGPSHILGSLVVGQPFRTDSDTIGTNDTSSSGSSSSSSTPMPRKPPRNYTTDTTPGCEYEECYSTTPRSFSDPYEQYLLAQSSMASESHNAPGSNYTTTTDNHEEAHFDDMTNRLKNMKLEKENYRPDVVDTDPVVDDTLSSDDVRKSEEFATAEHSALWSSDGNKNGLNGIPDDQSVSPALATIKQEDLGSCMVPCHPFVMMQAKITQCSNQQDGNSSQSTSGSHIEGSTSNQGAHFLNGSNGLPSNHGDQKGQGQDDDEDKKRSRKRKRGPAAVDRQKFACPYFKRSPAEHSKQGACTGPGFISIHRLKYATTLNL